MTKRAVLYARVSSDDRAYRLDRAASFAPVTGRKGGGGLTSDWKRGIMR
jgi:hypothetical protein